MQDIIKQIELFRGSTQDILKEKMNTWLRNLPESCMLDKMQTTLVLSSDGQVEIWTGIAIYKVMRK